MKYLEKILNWGLLALVFLLPWQTRLIYHDAIIKDWVWEYGRLSLYGTEILLVILLIIGIVIKFSGHPDVRQGRSRDPIIYATLAFLAYTALSLIWSPNKALAGQALLWLLLGTGLFWLIAEWKPKNLKIVLISSGLIQAIFGLYQFLHLSSFGSKWLGLSAINPTTMGTSVVEFLDQRWLRAYGALPHPNILAAFLAVCLMLAVWSLIELRQKIENEELIPKKDLYLNLFYWLSAIIIFAGLIVCFSRAAWLAFGVGFAYVLIYFCVKKKKFARNVCLKAAAIFVLLLGLFMVSFPYQLILVRFNLDSPLEKYSIEQRVSGYGEAKQIILNHPVLGTGLGNYTVALQKLMPEKLGWYYQPAHSLFLLVLAELGPLGLLLFLTLLFLLFIQANSIGRSLLIIFGILALFDHYLWSMYFGILLWWLVWGIINKKIKFIS